jgi:hypothetical protein
MNKKDWKEYEKLVQALKWSLHYTKKYIEEAPSQKHSMKMTIECFEDARSTLEKAEQKLSKKGA